MSLMPQILRYSEDSEAGISRHKNGDTITYLDAHARLVTNQNILKRIGGLGLPPAYADVWICSDEIGHLQATGRDAAGRKQYRYHAAWTEFRDKKKYNSLKDFGQALPAIRRRVRRDIRRGDNSQEFVSAAIVRLIDTGALRIGNPRNRAVGASTLRRKHINFTDDGLKLDYKAKGGKRVRKSIRDKTLSRVLQKVDDLPGREIFQFIDDLGQIRPLDSTQVNAYLGDNFTAKTFRTWHGSVTAFKVARAAAEAPTISAMCDAAAKRLHNTPAICRSSYIHPRIIELSKGGHDIEIKASRIRDLRKIESQLLAFL